MKKFALFAAAVVIGISSLATGVRAYAATNNQGLVISPIRQELHVSPGETASASIVVANLTKQDLDISLFFQEFSVTDENYDYTFQAPHYDWIHISQSEVVLHPSESRTISYDLHPEADASPGGYYFTIFASSTIVTGGITSTIQAASLLYVTVNGILNKSTHLDAISLPTVILSPDITYSFDATDSGNVYDTIYSIASLSNPFDHSQGQTAAHIIVPTTPRHMTGSLPAPWLPGIYTATIGYHTDDGTVITKQKTVLYLPLWGLVIFIGIVIVIVKLVRIVIKRRRR